MSLLLPIIAAEIKSQGPLSVARYMAMALGHDQYGYYTKQDPFGAQGDFITSPEISQMFGEMLGLWCAAVDQSLGLSGPINLVELGPGRGTLMCDALRAAGSVPGFLERVRVSLVETSPVLRARQKTSLEPFDVEVTWYDRFEDVTEGPMLVIGNEFFDAMPVHQYVRAKDGWFERLVGLAKDQSTLVFELSADKIDQNLIAEVLLNTAKIDDVFEDQAISKTIMTKIAERLVAHGGAAVFLDYGHDQHALGDTFQAMRTHQFVDVLSNPGDQDLTVHVDFEQMSQAAKKAGADVYGPLAQGVFLESLGLRQRAGALKASATQDQLFDVNRAYSRLTSPEQMGSLFRVIALGSSGQRMGSSGQSTGSSGQNARPKDLNVPPWS
ncbi:MAG: SAM-dependent methyltransferase [Magnetovibrio sp.]|nr:SAM-dependent methyltransferase [Magnetovibrio sp.]